MQRLAVGVLLVLGTSSLLMAHGVPPCAVGCVVKAPEIDPTAGIAAIALLGGVVLIVRGRRKKA
jgi:hypothetical protein